MPEDRLQKILARAGYGSRRAAEGVIAAGRVSVNGTVATLGAKADPDHDHIEVDGQSIAVETAVATIMLNKPTGYVVTAHDEEGRPTIYDLLPGAPTHLRYVGRLDLDTSGLLILTTDGDLAHRLTHPRYEVEKEYDVWAEGVVHEDGLDALRMGVELEDGLTKPVRIKRIPGPQPPTHVRLVIHEGRNRQVRRMFDVIGHPVFRLQRRRVGALDLGDLPLGTSRPLTPDEERALRTAVGL
jgi:23S rRNA pseudouridine2605 synthase